MCLTYVSGTSVDSINNLYMFRNSGLELSVTVYGHWHGDLYEDWTLLWVANPTDGTNATKRMAQFYTRKGFSVLASLWI